MIRPLSAAEMDAAIRFARLGNWSKVAEERGVAYQTVKNQAKAIREKTGTDSSTAAIAALIRYGAIVVGPPDLRAMKDRMRIVCCGCGSQIDLARESRLDEANTDPPRAIAYLASCTNCGLTHRLTVSRA